jgi:taurine-pyruvate aminotransferase
MDLETQDRESLWHALMQHSTIDSKPPLRAETSHGCYVANDQGRRYFDGVSGLWCVNVGYGRKELAETARQQMEDLCYFPLTQSHAPAIRLAGKMLELLDMEGKVFFSSSGSEANEVAFKIVRQYHAQKKSKPGTKYKIISRYRGYHGNTMGALSATAQAERKHLYEPLVPGFLHIQPPYCYRCPFGKEPGDCGLACADALESTIVQEGADSVAAFIMEPVIAGGGVIVSPDGYLQRIREICDKYDVILILDEVVTGFGRTGQMFGHQHWGVQPDVMTVAKGVSSGYMPLSATFAKQSIFEAFLDEPGTMSHFRHVSTYGGHPVATAVGLANIGILEGEGLTGNAAEMGERLINRLKTAEGHPWIGEIRGKGLLMGIELVKDKKSKEPLEAGLVTKIIGSCLEKGFIIGRNANTVPGFANVLIIAPPLVVTPEEIDQLSNVVLQAIIEVSATAQTS